jgi:hypothetical protein
MAAALRPPSDPAPPEAACGAAPGRPPPGDAFLHGAFPRGAFPHGAFPHGAFLVEPDGGLHPLHVPVLSFAWRGLRCEARVRAGLVGLSAAIGQVPYTAERPEDRPGALAAVAALTAELPAGWRLRLRPDHRLRLETDRALPAPTTAVALVAAMVGFVLALDPYLERLASAGMSGAGEAAG